MVEAVNRSELKSHCFELETTKKKIYIACRSDEELYSWMDEIYNVSEWKGRGLVCLIMDRTGGRMWAFHLMIVSVVDIWILSTLSYFCSYHR